MSAFVFHQMAMVVAVGFALMTLGTEGTCIDTPGSTTVSTSSCSSYTDSATCTGGSFWTACSGSFVSTGACCWNSVSTYSTYYTGSTSSCSWSSESQDKYAKSTGAAVSAAIVLGIIYIVVISLPLCCGVMKDQKQIVMAAAVVIGLLGFLNLFIPLFGSMGGCAPIAKDICDSCAEGSTCNQGDIENACNALGFLFVYTFACGWIACPLGIIASCLSICVCCGCGGMKPDAQNVVLAPVILQQAPAQGVVGAPVMTGKVMDNE